MALLNAAPGGGTAARGTTVVYRAFNAAGDVIYVGITDNFGRRSAEHAARFAIVPLMRGLSRAEARAVEQVLIDLHGLASKGGTLLNRINSIARSNPIYQNATAQGAALLHGIGYLGF